MVELQDVYVDVELLRDGTARWLWRLMVDETPWRAGVAMSRTDAEGAARDALRLWGERAREGKRTAGCRPTTPCRLPNCWGRGAAPGGRVDLQPKQGPAAGASEPPGQASQPGQLHATVHHQAAPKQ